nr:hypothetical protein BaRGS_024783 [Batillaria attramentaria]
MPCIKRKPKPRADSSVSIATNTSDVSSCMDSFKVPAPPSDSMFGDIFADLDPAAVLQKIQGEPLPIPISKQRGWWKINDMEQVRQMYNCLLSRGVREKNMAYSIRKYMELCSQVCTEDSGKTQMIKTEIKEETPESDPKPSDSDKQDDNSNSATADSDKTEVKVKQEKLEESEEETKKDEAMDVGTEDVDDAIPADPEESWNVRAGFEVEMACLEDVEALEDRIFNASLQVKQAWKLPQRATEDPEIRMVDRSVVDPVAPECYPMDVARSRLLLLESNIERRYLKPPLMRNVQLNLVNIATAPEPRSSRSTCADTKSDKTADESREEEEDEMDTSHEEVIEQSEDVPPGLMLWRRAPKMETIPDGCRKNGSVLAVSLPRKESESTVDGPPPEKKKKESAKEKKGKPKEEKKKEEKNEKKTNEKKEKKASPEKKKSKKKKVDSGDEPKNKDSDITICGYKHRSEFAADVHLILNNCETFNEDDSEVGMAGHSLRKFFRQRWRELFSEDS